MDVSSFLHMLTNQIDLFADQQFHTNGIDSFWNQGKRYSREFNGVKREYFY